MLKRVQKILNIGRFADCRTPGCEFSGETIIFGYNTQGKSTFTAILRSIQPGNGGLLIGRKTFGSTGAKNIEIDFEENNANDKYIFQNRLWNKSNPNILIFDSKFISENVFDGENITFEQQKSLNTVIIGKRGQDLNKEIVALQEKSDEFASKKGEKTREFNSHFPAINFETFKSLTKDDLVDEKIKDKEKEIKFEREKEEIKKAVESHIQNISKAGFSSTREILAKTLDVKHQEIEDHIRLHYATPEKARNFLSDGLNFLKEKTAENPQRVCVFCGQELGEKSEALISLYSAFFRGGYEQLQKEINAEINNFKGINLEAVLEKIALDLRVKDLEIGLSEVVIRELVELKIQFEQELEKKRDLNHAINFDTFDRLCTGVEQIKKDLQELLQKKINVPSPKTIAELEKERLKLEVIKKRHQPIWEQFCVDMNAIEAEAEKVRADRDNKRKELENYSSVIFETHKESINELCRAMGADFEVDDFRPLKKLIGKDERIFAIKFFGNHKVNLDKVDDQVPNFKNTLSESDKRLLAFAFFLSLLSHDRELDKRIIVFDDPMSSLDNERRRRTAQLISDITYTYTDTDGTEKALLPRQKVILTHEDRFAKELARLMPNAVTLKIEEYVDGNQKRSKIAHADFFKEFPDDDISVRIEKIKDILDRRTFSIPFEEDCRVVLEHIFKRKYYLELKELIEQKKSVRTFVTKLHDDKIGTFDDDTKFKKFTRLCDYLNIELHDNSSTSSNGDRESVLNDFFDCLKEI